jgi:hypothetical protein
MTLSINQAWSPNVKNAALLSLCRNQDSPFPAIPIKPRISRHTPGSMGEMAASFCGMINEVPRRRSVMKLWIGVSQDGCEPPW